MSRLELSLAYLFYGGFMGRFIVAKQTCPNFLSFTWRENSSDAYETLVFFTPPLQERQPVAKELGSRLTFVWNCEQQMVAVSRNTCSAPLIGSNVNQGRMSGGSIWREKGSIVRRQIRPKLRPIWTGRPMEWKGTFTQHCQSMQAEYGWPYGQIQLSISQPSPYTPCSFAVGLLRQTGANKNRNRFVARWPGTSACDAHPTWQSLWAIGYGVVFSYEYSIMFLSKFPGGSVITYHEFVTFYKQFYINRTEAKHSLEFQAYLRPLASW